MSTALRWVHARGIWRCVLATRRRECGHALWIGSKLPEQRHRQFGFHRRSERVSAAAGAGGGKGVSGRPGALPRARRIGEYHAALIAQGDRGHLRFNLQRVTGGVYVEREEIPARGPRTIQSITFSEFESFERWCDDDPVRFEHPLLHAQVKREGAELWRVAAMHEGR